MQGLFNHYGHFVENYSELAKSLQELIRGWQTVKRENRMKERTVKGDSGMIPEPWRQGTPGWNQIIPAPAPCNELNVN